MGRKWTFEDAVAVWLKLREADDASDDQASDFEQAEIFLLQHMPQSGAEADTLIQVIMDQCGERCDGLDQAALMALRAYVRSPSAQRAA
ncbi:MAG: hypothetical protein EON91_02760 [Brevundimonas sp.]|uniref:hypothetical protein n=1 Tax=Brevundimonas sp. TaxID=1871086 RepID=UPI00120A200C|nr:hypothetical protein [Brevundimonas sp.]RZJ19135.1 MAG: hypothetical protein EON91_02760 [Brevundimonas sp.]